MYLRIGAQMKLGILPLSAECVSHLAVVLGVLGVLGVSRPCLGANNVSLPLEHISIVLVQSGKPPPSAAASVLRHLTIQIEPAATT